MSYQSFGFRRECAAAHLARRNPASPVTLISAVCSMPPSRARSVYFDVAGGEAGAAKVRGAEGFAAVEHDGNSGALIVEVGEEFELDLSDGSRTVSFPTPDSLGVGLELGVAECPLESGGID